MPSFVVFSAKRSFVCYIKTAFLQNRLNFGVFICFICNFKNNNLYAFHLWRSACPLSGKAFVHNEQLFFAALFSESAQFLLSRERSAFFVLQEQKPGSGKTGPR